MKKPALITLICIMIVSGLEACSSGRKNKVEDPLPQGEVIRKVSCKKDKATNYALYIPFDYDSTKTYPLIIAFDSHADGVRPVTLFKEQAEKYGYIVVGSNNSKNGTPWNTTNAIYYSMLTDISERFSIDKRRIYTAGFSGGSRVASTIAIENGGIAGVIGFSAGFPNINKPISTQFDYLGVVGNTDFNYNEMNQLDKNLEDARFNHFLIVFDGKHEWPPDSIIPDIFYWIEFSTYRQKSAPINNNIIKEFTGKNEEAIEAFTHNKNFFEAYMGYQKLIHFLSGVISVEKYEVSLSELAQTMVVKNEQKSIEADIQKEQSLQMFYSEAMNSKHTEWWLQEVNKINKIISQNKNKRESLIYKRVYSFLSISAYSYSNNALKNNQLEQAQHYTTIYALVDPENSETAYFQTILNVRMNQYAKALEALEKAINLGFNDVVRMQNDTDISKLSSLPRYNQLIKNIQ